MHTLYLRTKYHGPVYVPARLLWEIGRKAALGMARSTFVSAFEQMQCD